MDTKQTWSQRVKHGLSLAYSTKPSKPEPRRSRPPTGPAFDVMVLVSFVVSVIGFLTS